MRCVLLKKKERHQLLKELIEEQTIQKQDEFVTILEKRGIKVTQATISRDIKELQLMKIPAAAGGYRYSLPPDLQHETSKKLEKMLKDGFISMDKLEYFIIIHTAPGNAFAFGALLDGSSFDEIFGTISGDDTLLVICRSIEHANQLEKRLIQSL